MSFLVISLERNEEAMEDLFRSFFAIITPKGTTPVGHLTRMNDNF